MDDVQPAPEVQSNNLTTDQGAEMIKSLMFPQEQPSAAPAEAEEAEQVEEEAVEPAEEQAEDVADDEPTTEELHEVTVDGKKLQVPLEELKKGYQLEAHYTQKSQKLAEERKAVEAERAVLQGVNQKFEQLNEVVVYLEASNNAIQAMLPPEPDKGLLDSNPGAYLKAKEARDQAMTRLQQNLGAIEQTKAQAKAMVAELQRAGAMVIKEKMPELLQPETSQKLYDYLQTTYGYSTEQINMNVDPNIFIIAEKARKFDELQSKAIEPKHVAQKATKAKPKQKAYSNSSDLRQKAARVEFQNKPNQKNAAALIKELGFAKV